MFTYDSFQNKECIINWDYSIQYSILSNVWHIGKFKTQEPIATLYLLIDLTTLMGTVLCKQRYKWMFFSGWMWFNISLRPLDDAKEDRGEYIFYVFLLPLLAIMWYLSNLKLNL